MGLLVEVMVSVLLAVTIWYCVMLDRRLKRFKEDEESFRKLIGDLTTASMRAEATVPGLRIATAEAEQGLGESLKRAEAAIATLQRGTQDGEDVLRRIAQIIAANRAAENAALAGSVPAQDDNVTALSANRIERLSDAARAARELALKARDRKLAEAA
jgi:Flp pilus assembly protein TadB